MCRLLFIIVATLLVASCKDKPTQPKPLGYARIDIPKYNYITSNFQYFSFNRSSLSQIESESTKNINWFNINYPDFKATIYCTYIPMGQKKITELREESHRLAFSHAIKADNISQTSYTDSTDRVYGIIYTIEGDVATPCQFFLTDSMTHFLRGSFYYDSEVNADSVAEVTKTIRTDIKNIVTSLRWR